MRVLHIRYVGQAVGAMPIPSYNHIRAMNDGAMNEVAVYLNLLHPDGIVVSADIIDGLTHFSCKYL